MTRLTSAPRLAKFMPQPPNRAGALATHGRAWLRPGPRPIRDWPLDAGEAQRALRPCVPGGDLVLDAAQEVMVGVAERADTLALKLGGDGGQVEPGCRRRCQDPFRTFG